MGRLAIPSPTLNNLMTFLLAHQVTTITYVFKMRYSSIYSNIPRELMYMFAILQHSNGASTCPLLPYPFYLGQMPPRLTQADLVDNTPSANPLKQLLPTPSPSANYRTPERRLPNGSQDRIKTSSSRLHPLPWVRHSKDGFEKKSDQPNLYDTTSIIQVTIMDMTKGGSVAFRDTRDFSILCTMGNAAEQCRLDINANAVQ